VPVPQGSQVTEQSGIAGDEARGRSRLVAVMERPEKITFGEMRASGVRGLLLIYCSGYHCSHWTAISGDRWSDDARLSDIENGFVCTACRNRGAEVRPDFDWDKKLNTRNEAMVP
jgi:hypothetical protein